MDRKQLINNIKQKRSFLCLGLDSDCTKIPKHLHGSEDPVFEFNKAIIDATHDLVVAYKPNLAFYESRGVKGLQSLEKTMNYLQSLNCEAFTIADAKRGDIGNTSAMYARTFFGNMDFDSVTVAPYMGEDSVTPFLTYDGKWVTLLALTSNKGALDFQFMRDVEGEFLFQKVLKTSLKWGTDENMMYVIGATKAEMLTDVRAIVPEHFLLVPGVGAQGGSLQEVAKYGLNSSCGLLVNSSRQIIYAASDNSFAIAAREEAQSVQTEMEQILFTADLI
jgi:orotidine-5'-phosphate decarboxylase